MMQQQGPERERALLQGCGHLQEPTADHALHASIDAPVQLEPAAIQEEAAEIVGQGGLHVQIQLPQRAASADEDLQHPV